MPPLSRMYAACLKNMSSLQMKNYKNSFINKTLTRSAFGNNKQQKKNATDFLSVANVAAAAFLIFLHTHSPLNVCLPHYRALQRDKKRK